MNPSIQQDDTFMRSERKKKKIIDMKSWNVERRREKPTYRFLEPGDKVIPVLLFLQTSECHLGAGDVLQSSSVLDLLNNQDTRTPVPFSGSQDTRTECSPPM